MLFRSYVPATQTFDLQLGPQTNLGRVRRILSHAGFDEITAKPVDIQMTLGETIEDAVKNGRDALKSTIAALKSKGLPVPAANSGGSASGKFVARVPKTIHAQLASRAKVEGVSLNTLVLTYIAQGLGRREGRA